MADDAGFNALQWLNSGPGKPLQMNPMMNFPGVTGQPIGGALPASAMQPKSFIDRIWDNYASKMSPEEFLQSESLWGGAKQIAESSKNTSTPFTEAEAFSRIANIIFKKMGVDYYLTPQSANDFMGNTRGKYMMKDFMNKRNQGPITGQ